MLYPVWSILLILPLVLSQKCLRSEFRCSNGICISVDNACDGEINCADESDETNALCANVPCTFGFKCKYGACVSRASLCNGVRDCADGSDEQCLHSTTPEKPMTPSNTTCGQHQNTCESGQCIESWLFCDGEKHCSDGSDETAEKCSNVNCPDYSFRCSYGACIERSLMCNNVINCVDGSDETDPSCAKPIDSPQVPPNSTPLNDCEATIKDGRLCNVGNETDCIPTGGKGRVNEHYKVVCDPKYYLVHGHDHQELFFCQDNGWNNRNFPTCKQGCRLIMTESHDFECTLNNDFIPCNQTLPIDSTVTGNCKDFYVSPPGVIFYKKCTSPSDFSFDKCHPVCGAYNQPREDSPDLPAYPWAALVMTAKGGSNKVFCSGVVLSTRVILSSSVIGLAKERIEDLSVVVGRSNVNSIGGKWEQIAQVSEIIYVDGYSPSLDNRLNDRDVCLIRLKTPLRLTEAVQPVCLPHLWKMSPIGLAVGYGLTNSRDKSYGQLKSVEFCILPFDECRLSVHPNERNRVVTYDKLCASTNNSCGARNIQEGLKHSKTGLDYGVPLVVKDSVSRKYGLRGVSSTFPTKSTLTFSTFTDLRYSVSTEEKYMEWVRKKLKEIEETK